MQKRIMSIFGIFALPALMFFIFYFLSNGFGFHSIRVILSQCMIPVTMGLAMAMVMQAGLMDFSPGARVVLGAALGAVFADKFGMAGLIIGCFIGAMIGGVIIALLYRYLRIPSMVVSLGVVLVLEVVSYKISEMGGSAGALKVTNELSKAGSYPNNIIISAIACVVFYIIMYKTKLGCLIKAVGNDEVMVKSMGVNTDHVKFKAFVISGVFCIFGAVLQICYAGTVTLQTGMVTMNMVFKPMMGVMIGLQLIRLFDNMPLMIFIGELTIAIIFNGFISLGLTDNIQNIILGAFLLIVMGISQNNGRFADIRRRRMVKKQSIA